MVGVKRKNPAGPKRQDDDASYKKLKIASKGVDPPIKPRKPRTNGDPSIKIKAKKEAIKERSDSEDLVESDTTEDYEGFGDSADSGVEAETNGTDIDTTEEDAGGIALTEKAQSKDGDGRTKAKILQEGQSSKEAHAKQRVLAKERKLAKPNADSIHRSKKLWERLRRKSHVPKQEREQLVAELYDIITGRVKDFVFKHDSVRVVQCALKYANMQQRKMIAQELKGEYKTLAESRYAKFLIGKLLVEGDAEIRDLIIPEFYGHVRRMINHPEASWIIDDIYRQVATSGQKELFLREWYGAEFAVFKNPTAVSVERPTAELSTILTSAPEKRKPIMNYLFQMLNQLIQKRMTAFTMLHDAMLQYFLNISPASEEYLAFVDLLRPDSSDESDGAPDLLKNLAFTSSGSRLVCLVLAHANANNRRALLKVFKDNIQLMAYDPNAHTVLLTAYTVVDDTREVAKTILPELVGTKLAEAPTDAAVTDIRQLATHLVARRTLLYPLIGSTKALLTGPLQTHMHAVRLASQETSKKQPELRSAELARALLPSLLAAIAACAADLIQTNGFGAQFVADVLLAPHADAEAKMPAAKRVAELAAAGDPKEPDHPFCEERPWAGRMLKTLVLGGRFDAKAQNVVRDEGWAEVGFPRLLWPHVKGELISWATGGSSFVVVNLLEVGEGDGGLGDKDRKQLLEELKKGRKALEEAARSQDEAEARTKKSKEGKEGNEQEIKGSKKGNVGAKMLLERLK